MRPQAAPPLYWRWMACRIRDRSRYRRCRNPPDRVCVSMPIRALASAAAPTIHGFRRERRLLRADADESRRAGEMLEAERQPRERQAGAAHGDHHMSGSRRSAISKVAHEFGRARHPAGDSGGCGDAGQLHHVGLAALRFVSAAIAAAPARRRDPKDRSRS